jgi:hypothetical protein
MHYKFLSSNKNYLKKLMEENENNNNIKTSLQSSIINNLNINQNQQTQIKKYKNDFVIKDLESVFTITCTSGDSEAFLISLDNFKNIYSREITVQKNCLDFYKNKQAFYVDRLSKYLDNQIYLYNIKKKNFQSKLTSERNLYSINNQNLYKNKKFNIIETKSPERIFNSPNKNLHIDSNKFSLINNSSLSMFQYENQTVELKKSFNKMFYKLSHKKNKKQIIKEKPISKYESNINSNSENKLPFIKTSSNNFAFNEDNEEITEEQETKVKHSYKY